MNNKGFAITTVIYGLSILGIMIVMILMGTLSSTRNNVSEEAKMVEEFLIAFNQTEVTYRTNGNYNYSIPKGETGWYRIEAFGPSGCGTNGANGSYTTGIIYLEEGDVLNLKIGSCNGVTTVGVNNAADVIMRAPGGYNTTPGGNTYCYNKNSLGGDIDMNNFGLRDPSKSLIGNDGVTFTSCSGNSQAYIRGYPASGTGSWNYFFVDGLMMAGAHAESNGKVIINRLAERDGEVINTIPRKNTLFNGANTINISSPYPIDSVYYSYQEADGDKFKGHVVKCSSTTSCNTGGKNIDDISIIFRNTEWHKNLSGVSVTINGNTVFASNYGGIPATPLGIHLSAYQPNTYDGDLNSAANDFAKHGNYYLIPIVSENKTISAALSAADDADKLKINYMTGDSRQKWSIDLLNVPGNSYKMFENINNVSSRYEYRIMELTRFKAMSIYYDENYKTNFISAPETFNSLSRNEPQIWNIYPLGDGTCAIKTVVESFDSMSRSGFLFAKTRGLSVNNIDDIMIGGVSNNPDQDYQSMPTSTERFWLYSLDFSK